MKRKIEVYGAMWCHDTRQTLATLDKLGVNYTYVDVGKDEKASAWVKEQNKGAERKPTLKVGNEVLAVPSEGQLRAALQRQGWTLQ